MQLALTLLRVLHIACGAVALLSFGIPLAVAKGNRLHRRAGWVYAVAMFAATATSLVVVPLRLAERPVERWGMPLFLGFIGILSFAATFHAVRVLRMKRSGPVRSVPDLGVPLVLVAASIGIGAYGIAHGSTLAMGFAPVGLVTAVPQLRTLLRPPESPTWWLSAHLSNMVIACIGTVTAFLVNVAANTFDAARSPIVWFVPTLVMLPMSRYFRRKYAPKPKVAPGMAGN